MGAMPGLATPCPSPAQPLRGAARALPSPWPGQHGHGPRTLVLISPILAAGPRGPLWGGSIQPEV